MATHSTEVLRLELRCDLAAPGAVRASLRQVEAIAEVREDATLVASELVSNAVLHSGCEADEQIQVSAVLNRDRLTISVRDPGVSDNEPALRPDGDSASGGMGLRIVQHIARRWGTEVNGGRRVWAELAV
jgi:anti-sigma regulatory factor (Ser/Thr protein kinase)